MTCSSEMEFVILEGAQTCLAAAALVRFRGTATYKPYVLLAYAEERTVCTNIGSRHSYDA